MRTHNEVKIAIAVGAIMITICLVIFLVYNSNKNNSTNTNIKVYKHYDINGSEKGEYHECRISTEDIYNIYSDYKKIKLLKDDDKAPGEKITGIYKITNGDDFIAFDNNVGYVFRGDTMALYAYKSDLYDYVIDLCK